MSHPDSKQERLRLGTTVWWPLPTASCEAAYIAFPICPARQEQQHLPLPTKEVEEQSFPLLATLRNGVHGPEKPGTSLEHHRLPAGQAELRSECLRTHRWPLPPPPTNLSLLPYSTARAQVLRCFQQSQWTGSVGNPLVTPRLVHTMQATALLKPQNNDKKIPQRHRTHGHTCCWSWRAFLRESDLYTNFSFECDGPFQPLTSFNPSVSASLSLLEAKTHREAAHPPLPPGDSAQSRALRPPNGDPFPLSLSLCWVLFAGSLLRAGDGGGCGALRRGRACFCRRSSGGTSFPRCGAAAGRARRPNRVSPGRRSGACAAQQGSPPHPPSPCSAKQAPGPPSRPGREQRELISRGSHSSGISCRCSAAE